MSITLEDTLAADFVISLWGKKRRAFARKYWLFLRYGYPEPVFADCFGADHIARTLNHIYGFRAPYDAYFRGE